MKQLMCSARLKGVTPISFSAPVCTPKDRGESSDAHEKRICRERLHLDAAGNAAVPGMAVKNMLTVCARFLSQNVPGKGKATFTKHFEAGLMVPDQWLTIEPRVNRDDVELEDLYVPSDGRKGGGKRVWRHFPVIRNWSVDVMLVAVDPTITARPDVIEDHLRHAGIFVGLLRWRPINGGVYGKFEVTDWEAEIVDPLAA